MINLSEKDVKFIKKNFENSDEMINNFSVNEILDAIDDLIIYKGFTPNYDYNDFGREAQKVYDSIYVNN